MKTKIHPNYFLTKVVCVCGNNFEVGGTVPELHVEVCSQCHPFYTGKQKGASSGGRIDRFNKRYNRAAVN